MKQRLILCTAKPGIKTDKVNQQNELKFMFLALSGTQEVIMSVRA